MYDPKTKKVVTIETCFGTHHLNFDDNDVLWFTGSGPVEGFFDTRIHDKTGDEKAGDRLDGAGARHERQRQARCVRRSGSEGQAHRRPVLRRFTGVRRFGMGSVLGMPGSIVRLVPGPNPTETALAEIYEVPYPDAKAQGSGYAPRGMDVDGNNVGWTTLSSGQLASFDRRKCKGPLNGPTATGKHCPEGCAFYSYPGPNYKGAVDSASAEFAYYNFVDRFDMLGVGKEVPLATGNASEALLALVDGRWLTLRVPYPMGFYAKRMDGRIDDARARWKGKGIWTTFATRAPFHVEGGKGTTSKLAKFQMRTSPLDK